MKETESFPKGLCAWACAPVGWDSAEIRPSDRRSPQKNAPDASSFSGSSHSVRRSHAGGIHHFPTKGGVARRPQAANLGGFAADAGLRVLLLDLDVQPTCRANFRVAKRRCASARHLRAGWPFKMQDMGAWCRATVDCGPVTWCFQPTTRVKLNTLLLHAPDGPTSVAQSAAHSTAHYDLLLSTRRAHALQWSCLKWPCWPSDWQTLAITPQIKLACTRIPTVAPWQLMRDNQRHNRRLGIEPPPLRLLINRVHRFSSNCAAHYGRHCATLFSDPEPGIGTRYSASRP